MYYGSTNSALLAKDFSINEIETTPSIENILTLYRQRCPHPHNYYFRGMEASRGLYDIA